MDPKIFLTEVEYIFPQIIEKNNYFPCEVKTSLIGHFMNPSIENESENIKYINTKNIFLRGMNPNPSKWLLEYVYETLLKIEINSVEW